MAELLDVLRGSNGTSTAAAAAAALVMVATLGVVVLLKTLKFTSNYLRIRAALKAIPSAPGGNFFLGHVIALLKCVVNGKAAWDMMEEWIKGSPAPLVRYRILGTQGIALRDPQALKRIFQTRFKIYEKDLELSYHPFLPILGTGLVTSDGDLWQKQRLLMAPALRNDILDEIIPIAKRAVDRLITKLAPYKGTGQPVDIQAEFHLLTLQVIGEAVLSMAPEECDKIFPRLYIPVMEEANQRVLRPHRKYLPTPEWFAFRSRMKQLNAFLINFFRQRWAARQAGVKRDTVDILDRVMEALEASDTKWTTEVETQLCYEIKTFLLAGHETSASMLTWAIYELSSNQKATAEVRAEADAAFKGLKPGEAPPRRAVDDMVYTLSVLKETLRRYSVVPVVTRKLAQDDELLGYKIPAGTMIACIIQGTHNLYKEPEVFRPERFMPGGEYDGFDEADRLFMFVPFIQGPRNCLGQHLALLEARVVLSSLMKAYTWRTAKPGQGVRHPTVIPVAPMEHMSVLID